MDFLAHGSGPTIFLLLRFCAGRRIKGIRNELEVCGSNFVDETVPRPPLNVETGGLCLSEGGLERWNEIPRTTDWLTGCHRRVPRRFFSQR